MPFFFLLIFVTTLFSSEKSLSHLSDLEYYVTQKEGTEAPFKNAYWDNKIPGIYVDVVDKKPLFSSLDKFKSGTGWPSFHKPIDSDMITYKEDYKIGYKRTEVRSKKANSHLGHLFFDAPSKEKTRYCINSAALTFIPFYELREKGYAKYAPEFDKRYGIAVFGAGCFWGVEEILRQIEGVIDTEAGYMGGIQKNATYEHVSTGKTGHAEVVRILYDKTKVTYQTLLDYFWRLHNPTTLNRQGYDIGTQYRSVIFYFNETQKKEALASKKRFNASNSYHKPAVTVVEKAHVFYPAQTYHQNYYFNKYKGKSSPICHKLRSVF